MKLKKNDRMISLRGEKTQRQIATELGIPVSTYAMVELGHRFPRRDLAMKLSAYFRVSVDELFFTPFSGEEQVNNSA